MSASTLYRGNWPQNISRLAKYTIKHVNGVWKVTVFCEVGDGLRYLAVEGGDVNVTARVNAVKTVHRDEPGGAFYVNEFRHILVPVKGNASSGLGSHCYYAGKLETDFQFEFEGKSLTTRPVHQDGTPLKAGEIWDGPRPGIPYVLSAGGGDIYYETPALTETDPPEVRPMVTRKVQLSKLLNDKQLVAHAVSPIANIRGHAGGRFYVNEHGAIFTPVSADDGNGINYKYCGMIDHAAWFTEPRVDE